MLIICKGCKKLIDTDKHDFCPKCGSNFNYGENLTAANHTADYEEYERRMAEQQRAAVENRMSNTKQATKKETQRRLKNQANQAQGKKNGCIGCFAVVIFLVASFGSILSDEDIDLDELFGDSYDTPYQTTTAYTFPEVSFYVPDYIDDETTDDNIETTDDNYSDNDVEYTHYILKGETAYTENYSLVCTEIAEYENELLPPAEGNKYISFTMKLENTSDSERFFYSSPTCATEYGEAIPAVFAGIFLPGSLDAGQVYESTVVFEVPEEAVCFDIYYNDDVVIFTSVADIDEYDWTQE